MSDAERRQLKQRLLPVLPEAEATRIVWNIASRKLLRKLVSQQTFTAMSPTDLLLFIRQKLAAGGPPVPAPGARQPISQATAQQPPQSRAQQPSSSGAQQTTRRSTRSTRTEPARNWSTQSTLPVAVRGGPPVPARQPLSAPSSGQQLVRCCSDTFCVRCESAGTPSGRAARKCNRGCAAHAAPVPTPIEGYQACLNPHLDTKPHHQLSP